MARLTRVDMGDLDELNDELAVYDDIEALDGQRWVALAGIYGIALKLARVILEDHHVDVNKFARDHDIFEALASMHPGHVDDIWYIFWIKPFYDFITRRLEVPIPFDANAPASHPVAPRARNATIRLLALAVQVRSRTRV